MYSVANVRGESCEGESVEVVRRMFCSYSTPSAIPIPDLSAMWLLQGTGRRRSGNSN